MIRFLLLLKSNRPLIFLLVAFVGLALFYSVIVPIFEGPDEDDHFRYAKFIADQCAFPVQLFEPGGGVAGHQGWQPPLYYSLAALIIAPIDTSDFSQQLARNYASTFVGDPSCCGRNLYYHPDSQNFPWTGTTLAVHLARLLSIFFGALTVAATYAIAKTILPDQSLVALATASVVAFNPSFLFSSALVSNDAPLAAFCALVLLMWVKWLNEKSAPTLKSAMWLGGLIGLALLTKTTALGLIPFSMLVIVVVAWRKRDWRFAIIGNVAMLVIVALVAGWWFVRNSLLYGDPLAYRLMNASAIFPRAGPLTPAELFQISLPWLWQTFWGGPTPGDFSQIILILLAVLTAVALIGALIRFLRITNYELRITILFLAAWLAFILVAQIQFIQTTVGADQGRYLFPAISAIATFFVIGLIELGQQFTTKHLVLPIGSLAHWLIGSLAFLALLVPFAYTLPAFARPPMLSENELARASHQTQINFANQIELRGYDLDTRAVKPGDSLRVTLYWRALASMNESYRVFVHLIASEDRSAGGTDVIPGHGAFPTLYWKPGDAMRDVVSIPVSANATPGKYSIEVGLYPVGKVGDRLTVIDSGDDRAMVDAIKIAPAQSVTFNPQTRVTANFADQIDLLGYDLSTVSNNLQITLYWRARVKMNEDYQVFVHALDANGNIIAQVDRQPQAGNYPTSIWDAGEQIRDDYVLAIPANVTAQKIEIGLYRAVTGERLPVQSGAISADHLLLNVQP